MNNKKIIRNLKQIQNLIGEDAPEIAKMRLGFLMDELKTQDSIDEDARLRQGRSERQVEDTYKILGWAILGAVIFSLIFSIIGTIV